MLRFVAVHWDPQRLEESTAAHTLSTQLITSDARWRSVFQSDGLSVFHVPDPLGRDDVYVLPNERGIVLGRLFHHDPRDARLAQPIRTHDLDSEAMLESQGSWLATHVWGRYVAFIRNGSRRQTTVLRDPLGTAQCFETDHRGLRIFFCRLEDCHTLGLSFSINWEYVAANLQLVNFTECAETGLERVRVVLGGERVVVSPQGTSRNFYWSPMHIAERRPMESSQEAMEALAVTTRGCVAAWAGNYSGVLHQLSGGLDSSIVAACLQKDAATHVVCLNQHSPGSDSDEREYARLVAGHLGLPLHERERNDTISLRPMLRMDRAVRPSQSGMNYLVFNAEVAELARAHGCTAVFTGFFGDELFYKNRYALAASDYVSAHGIRPKLLKVALDVSYASDVCFWRILADCIVRGFFTEASSNPTGNGVFSDDLNVNEFLTEDVRRRQSDRYLHPWLLGSGRLPSGKLWHIRQICCVPTLDAQLGSADDPEWIHPLLSQPLVEACLQTPTYVLIDGGWDRSIARRAFAEVLPAKIVTRRTKGGREEHAKRLVFNNIDFVREMLLDGELMRRGLLNRPRVEEALSARPTDVRSPVADLGWDLCTEAWLRVALASS